MTRKGVRRPVHKNVIYITMDGENKWGRSKNMENEIRVYVRKFHFIDRGGALKFYSSKYLLIFEIP